MADRNKMDKKHTYDILYGTLRGTQEDILTDREDSFAYAFLRLTQMVTGSAVPVDEAYLRTTENKLEYLKNVEGVYADYFSLEPGWHKQEMSPFMGFLGEEKTPVLLYCKNDCFHILFPLDNSEQRLTEETAGKLGSEALIILPHAKKEINSGGQLLFEAVRREKKEYGLLLILMIAASLISVAVPLVTSHINGFLLETEDISGIVTITISVLIGIIAGALINVVVERTRTRIQTRMDHFLMGTMLDRTMNLEVETGKKLSGRLITLLMPFMGSAGQLICFSATTLFYLVQSLIIMRMTFVFCPDIKGPMSLVIVGMLIVISFWQFLVYRKNVRLLEKDSRLSRARREILDNVEAIKSFSIEDRIFYRFAVFYDDKMCEETSAGGTEQLIYTLGKLAVSIVMLLAFLMVAGKTDMNAGIVSAVLSSLTLMMTYITQLVMASSEVVHAIPQMKFADELLRLPVENAETGVEEKAISGRIELRNVSFSYEPSGKPVIRNLSLEIKPGEYIGIVGSSGCGKSTLMKLLLGFMKPTSGNIYYDNVDIEKYNLRSLRRQFGVVLQGAPVINGTIRKNIGLSDDADMDMVREAAETAAVREDIEAMPMKYNTLLFGDAETISGGQRQRIAIARALIHKPRILFLDEATSAVDNINQKRISDNLKKLGVTRVAIAHRLSTVIHCDRIIVMDKGEIVEEGTYDELMALDGMFARLAKRNQVEKH
ncbi:MAG: ATP-binding cassette domain-containing protein [Eubacteriales bacterium]|nr:ATP-binding cassette domain-containing protein [Eubacteriales bacterium]